MRFTYGLDHTEHHPGKTHRMTCRVLGRGAFEMQVRGLEHADETKLIIHCSTSCEERAAQLRTHFDKARTVGRKVMRQGKENILG